MTGVSGYRGGLISVFVQSVELVNIFGLEVEDSIDTRGHYRFISFGWGTTSTLMVFSKPVLMLLYILVIYKYD